MILRLYRIAAAILSLCAIAPLAQAEESQFGYTYTTDLLPKGEKEVEQWATWRRQKVGGQFDQIDARTEVEYGLADNLQIAGYVNYAWAQAYHNGPGRVTTPPEPLSYDNPGPDDHYSNSRFVGLSGEAIYRILSPYTDPVGLAVYIEPTIGPRFREIEAKIILQKNFLDDRLILALNYTYAPEWRLLADDDSRPGVKSWGYETDANTDIGVSYRFMPDWSAGFEFLNEHEYNSFNYSKETNNGFYFGPTVHYGGKHFFVTATALEQLPWAHVHSATVDGAVVGARVYDNDFEKYRLRVKAGYYF